MKREVISETGASNGRASIHRPARAKRGSLTRIPGRVVGGESFCSDSAGDAGPKLRTEGGARYGWR